MQQVFFFISINMLCMAVMIQIIRAFDARIQSQTLLHMSRYECEMDCCPIGAYWYGGAACRRFELRLCLHIQSNRIHYTGAWSAVVCVHIVIVRHSKAELFVEIRIGNSSALWSVVRQQATVSFVECAMHNLVFWFHQIRELQQARCAAFAVTFR